MLRVVDYQVLCLKNRKAMCCTILLPTFPMQSEELLNISLTKQQIYCSLQELAFCIFNHQFSAMKKIGIAAHFNKKNISKIYRFLLTGKFPQSITSPFSLFLDTNKNSQRIPRLGLTIASNLSLVIFVNWCVTK